MSASLKHRLKSLTARAALKEGKQRKDQADKVGEAKLQSYDQTKDQTERAQGSVRSCQAVIQHLDAKEAEQIAQDGLAPSLSPEGPPRCRG